MVLPATLAKIAARRISPLSDEAVRLVWPLYAAAVCFTFLIAWQLTPMSPDSWTLYDLSRWIWRGDVVGGLRQYRVSTDFPISHPFVFPTLAGGVDLLLGTGFRSGLIVNAFALVILPRLVFLALRPISISQEVALLTAWGSSIGLCVNWFFLEEALAGRTMPVAACLIALALHFFFTYERLRDAGTAALLGLTLGVLALTRLDALPFCVTLILVAICLKKPGYSGWPAKMAAVVFFAFGLAPYLMYSISCCGTILATETSGILMVAPVTHPTTYWQATPPTIIDNPSVWIVRIFQSIGDGARALGLVLAVSPLPLFLMLFVKFPQNPPGAPQPSFSIVFAVTGLSLILLPSLLLSFLQARYLVVPISLIASILAVRRGSSLFDFSDHPRRRYAVIAVAGLVGVAGCGYGWSRSPTPLPEETVSRAVTCAAGGRIFVLGEGGPELAARGNVRTLIEPDNWSELTIGQKNEFFSEYSTYAIFSSSDGCVPLH